MRIFDDLLASARQDNVDEVRRSLATTALTNRKYAMVAMEALKSGAHRAGLAIVSHLQNDEEGSNEDTHAFIAYAAETNNLELATALLSIGVPAWPDGHNEPRWGSSAMAAGHAAAQGNLEMLSLLLESTSSKPNRHEALLAARGVAHPAVLAYLAGRGNDLHGGNDMFEAAIDLEEMQGADKATHALKTIALLTPDDGFDWSLKHRAMFRRACLRKTPGCAAYFAENLAIQHKQDLMAGALGNAMSPAVISNAATIPSPLTTLHVVAKHWGQDGLATDNHIRSVLWKTIDTGWPHFVQALLQSGMVPGHIVAAAVRSRKGSKKPEIWAMLQSAARAAALTENSESQTPPATKHQRPASLRHL